MDLRWITVSDERGCKPVADDPGHRVPHRRLTDLVVAEDRAGLIVNDVQRRAATQHFFRFFELEVPVLNDRLNPGLMEKLMDGTVVGLTNLAPTISKDDSHQSESF